MNAFDAYQEELNRKLRNDKSLIRFLRKVISSTKNDKIKKDAKVKLKDVQNNIDLGKSKKTYRDSVTGELKLRPRGGGAMTDLSQRTGATAKGTLFKKKLN